MSTNTTIEWTDATWNPVRGCAIVSPGCANCYAMRQAHRFNRPGGPYEGLTRATTKGPRWMGQVRLVPETLDQPLRWRTPRRIFVNSMSDLFHLDVPPPFMAQVFNVMASATLTCHHRFAGSHDDECWSGERHTFQVLTKRPHRALWFLRHGIHKAMEYWPGDTPLSLAMEWGAGQWPLPNLWLGVSVENQDALDRVDILRGTPAAVRWLSCEPLLEDLADALDLAGIHWVVVGGESGPGARPCNVAWVEAIVEKCKAAGVPVFVKQLGARPIHHGARRRMDRKGGDIHEFPRHLQVREFPA